MAALTDAADMRADALVRSVADAAEHVVRNGRAPGVAVALALGGRPLWHGAFGHADLASSRPMTIDTVTRAASVSKLYTAVAVMQLAETGAIDLGAPVASQVPGLRLRNPLGGREVTVLDLLTFSSGLNRDGGGATLTPPRPLDSHVAGTLAAGRLPEYGGQPLWTCRAGDRYQYSNLGIAILGLLIAHANDQGLTCSEYIRREIFEPLGMASSALPPAPTRAHVSSDLLDRLSTGYSTFGSAHVPAPVVFNACFPATGLLTTAADHLRLLLALASGGACGDARILSRASVERMLTPHVGIAQTELGEGWNAGIGTVIALDGSRTDWFGHAGVQTWGWTTDSRVYPDLGLALVVCCNGVEMSGWHDGAASHAAAFVADVACSALRRARSAPPKSWDWHVAYLAGLLLNERLRLLGIPDPLTPVDIDALVRGTVGAPHAAQAEQWDHDGFRRGAQDSTTIGPGPEGVRRFLAEDSALPVELLDPAWRSLGGRYPGIPVQVWDEDPPT